MCMRACVHVQVFAKYRKSTGGDKRKRIYDGECNMVICAEEIISTRDKMESLTMQLDTAKKLNEAKEQELKILYAQIIEERKHAEQKTQLTEKAKEFTEFANTGKPVHELRIRQQQRKKKEIQNKAQKALWFLESFGFRLTSMDVTCTATAENVSVTFDKENIAEPNAANTAATIEDRYEKLSEQSKTDIKKVLFLLDKFSGSDELYHEFTQLYNNMPRSYMVAHYRRRMNASYDILSLPEPFEGTRMELAPLLADDICRLFAAANIEEPSNETVTVKISGDGAQFSSTSSFVLMTYCILFGATNTQASSSHMSFAALKGSETYETLRDGFKDVWTEINALIKVSNITYLQHLCCCFYLSLD